LDLPQFGHVGDYDTGVVELDSGVRIGFHEERNLETEETIVFLHGLNGHSGTWRKNVPHFSARCRTFALSLPTFRGPFSEVPIERYASYVDEFLSKMLLREIPRLTFVGNSMGGWISMLLAAEYPSLARSLVLEDTAGARQEESKDLTRRLEEIRVPVQIVWGSEDNVLPLRVGKELAKRLPSANFTVVDSAGHVPHWERPDVFNRIVDQFLAGKRSD